MFTIATTSEGETQIINASTGSPVARYVDAAFARVFADGALHNYTDTMYYIQEITELGWRVEIIRIRDKWKCYAKAIGSFPPISGQVRTHLEDALRSLYEELTKEDSNA